MFFISLPDSFIKNTGCPDLLENPEENPDRRSVNERLNVCKGTSYRKFQKYSGSYFYVLSPF